MSKARLVGAIWWRIPWIGRVAVLSLACGGVVRIVQNSNVVLFNGGIAAAGVLMLLFGALEERHRKNDPGASAGKRQQ